MTKQIAISIFEKLIKDISVIYKGARNALALAYWRIGKHLIEVEQKGEVRAHYGEGLLQSVSDEMSKEFGKGFSVDNLEKMRRFYLTHKNSAAPRKLDWTKFVELLPVEDDEKRQELEDLAKRKNLSSRELREIVKKENERKRDEAQSPVKQILKAPLKLQLNTFKKVTDAVIDIPKDEILVDCGFYVFKNIGKSLDGNFLFTDKPSYTYRAFVERVVDGDTIAAIIDVGFGIKIFERLRLRGIDCPEVKTSEGEKAKRFVSGVLKIGQEIVIKTYKNDIYGRFVVDVFYSEKDAAAEEIVKNGIFLNQELLIRRLAKKIEM